ncbi:type II secretion system F family protein [uncultured Methanobrevibacter sp.]|uniref:type II secretion system F family protein n=1 Tax=uncultured Methanobrevibacter sp. TaxID=253161 RepID=UPI0025D60FA5|nr:type II secretion system F family protein [uncultured Methanobrevibacter sp.]
MSIIRIISSFSSILEDKFSQSTYYKLQSYLLNAGVKLYIYDLISIILIISLIFTILSSIFIFLLNINLVYILIPLISPSIISVFIISFKTEKRKEIIEKSAPDFLRQLSSILKVGFSFENAIDYLSQNEEGPLYDELRRTVIKIKLGEDFNESWIELGYRLNSNDLRRIFLIILDSRKSGSSVGDILDDLSYDLRQMNIIKEERKSSLTMAVMFLIISAVIAAPFAMAMVNIYSNFIISLGQYNPILSSASQVSELYIIIHSFLVGFIISLILYGRFKKGIIFSIPLVIISYLIFFAVSRFAIIFIHF